MSCSTQLLLHPAAPPINCLVARVTNHALLRPTAAPPQLPCCSRDKPCVAPPIAQVLGLQVDGLEHSEMRALQGTYTQDENRPEANGRPHYSTGTGEHHLYFSPDLHWNASGARLGEWLLHDAFTPDSGNCHAAFKTAGEVPQGEAVWQLYSGAFPGPKFIASA